MSKILKRNYYQHEIIYCIGAIHWREICGKLKLRKPGKSAQKKIHEIFCLNTGIRILCPLFAGSHSLDGLVEKLALSVFFCNGMGKECWG
jgi:hypothetical protein